MTRLIAKLHARATSSADRGAATLDLGLGAVLLGVTVVATITLFGGTR